MTNSNFCFFEQIGDDTKKAERGCGSSLDINRRDLKEWYNISDTECIKCNNALGCKGLHEIEPNKLIGASLAGNAMLCFCNTNKCNGHCEYNKRKCTPIEPFFNESNEFSDTDFERCDANELCGTEGDGTTKGATTVASGHETTSLTEGNSKTTLANASGGTDLFTASSILAAISTFIFLFEKLL